MCADAFTIHYFLHSPKCTLHEIGLLRGLDYKNFLPSNGVPPGKSKVLLGIHLTCMSGTRFAKSFKDVDTPAHDLN